ncbi:MAG: hypothetical protein ACLTA8_08135 [Intestinibacter bartlettii]
MNCWFSKYYDSNKSSLYDDLIENEISLDRKLFIMKLFWYLYHMQPSIGDKNNI